LGWVSALDLEGRTTGLLTRSAATEGTSSIHADYGEVESAIHKAKTRFGRKSPKAIIPATGNANHKVEKGSPTPTPDLVTDTSSK